MSTKCSVIWHYPNNNETGDGFHLFTDVLDDDPKPFYLRLDGVEFEASNHSVTVCIPREWAEKLGLVASLRGSDAD